jgi:stearoyl-CoA desaturase (Delta-9 desaturase)
VAFGPDLSIDHGLQIETSGELRARWQNRAADAFASVLATMPTRHEIVRRALTMFADTPPMDVIASRAHAVILDAIGARLSAMAAAQ